jgi:hypothetical protein
MCMLLRWRYAAIFWFLGFLCVALAQDTPAKPNPGSAPSQNAAGPRSTEKPDARTQTKCTDFTIDPAEARIAPGGSLTLTVTPAKNCTVSNLDWSLAPRRSDPSPVNLESEGSAARLTLGGQEKSIADAIKADASKQYLLVVAKAKDNCDQVAIARIVITLVPGGDIVIPVIGFEQTGASAAQSNQRFFYNFFINRKRGGNASMNRIGPSTHHSKRGEFT